MKEFKSFATFATHLQLLAIEGKIVRRGIVEAGAQEVQDTARGMIGFYHDDPHWPELSPEYEAAKVKAGYEADAPLLRTGEMRDSITHSISLDGNSATIGTDDQKMVWHELGTDRMPPRPVMSPAGAHSAPRIVHMATKAAVAWVAGHPERKPVVPKKTPVGA
jgi:phage gpG-like protein